MTMLRLISTLTFLLCLVIGCQRNDLLMPRQFTMEFAEVLRKSAPEFQVEIIRDLELKITKQGNNEHTTFLDNAYDSYKQDTREKDNVIARYVASGIEIYAANTEIVDKSRIVPIINDTGWLEEINESMRVRGAKKPLEHVYDNLNGDLVILYAEDSPKNIRYLTSSDIAKLKLSREKLRGMACENLKGLLPKIELHGDDGLYMLTAGGDYEASLLLLDSIWSNKNLAVKGDIVVAIPTRDLLLVTGSSDKEGISKLKARAKKSYDEGTYRLTQKLFVRRGGKFTSFAD